MRFHTLAGLPRAGTTLVGNVLAQHPDVYVSGTSALATAVEQLGDVLTSSPEVKSDLANVPGSVERYNGVIRAVIGGWYADRPEPVVVDKGRGWSMHRVLLDAVLPDAVSVVVVRDPRDVIASIERQHRRTGLFNSPFARTEAEVVALLMRPDGNVGGALRFAEDLIRRNLPSVAWVRYESLVRDPHTILAGLADRLGLTAHAWDTENVVNVASDLDALTLGKFPHDGSGPIKPTGTDWRDVLDSEIAEHVAAQAPLYMRTFGY